VASAGSQPFRLSSRTLLKFKAGKYKNSTYARTQLAMSDSVVWTAEAEARLKEIPFFVRPAARKKIEKFAAEQGLNSITVEVYEQAKQKFGSN
jgi:hypothetical protein